MVPIAVVPERNVTKAPGPLKAKLLVLIRAFRVTVEPLPMLVLSTVRPSRLGLR